jgi:hypothetical protein
MASESSSTRSDVADDGGGPELVPVLAQKFRDVADHAVGVELAVPVGIRIRRRDSNEADVAVVLHHEGERQEPAAALKLLLGGCHTRCPEGFPDR